MRVLRGNDIIINWSIYIDNGGLQTNAVFSNAKLSVFVLDSYGKREAEFSVKGNVISVHLGGETQRLGAVALDAYWQDNTTLTYSRAKKNDIVELVDNPESVDLSNKESDIDVITIGTASNSFFGGTYVANFGNYYTKNEINNLIIKDYDKLTNKPLIYNSDTGTYKASKEINAVAGITTGTFVAGISGAMFDVSGNGEVGTLIVRDKIIVNGKDISEGGGTGTEIPEEVLKLLSYFAYDKVNHAVYLKSIVKEGSEVTTEVPLGFYSNAYVSAKGIDNNTGAGGSGGGLNEELLWSILGDGDNPNKQIATTHLSVALALALSSYATNNHVNDVTTVINSSINTLTQRVTDHINNTNIHVTKEDKDAISLLISLFEVDANGDIKTKDYDKDGVITNRGFYSPSFISAKGVDNSAGSGSGGLNEALLWAILSNDSTEQIALNHLTGALTGYVTTAWISNKNYATTSYVNDADTLTRTYITTLDTDLSKRLSDVYTSLSNDITTITTNLSTLKTAYDEHAANKVVHITAAERLLWNKVSAYFAEDTINKAIYVTEDRGFYSNSYLSAKGTDSIGGSGSGLNEELLWAILANDGTEQIALNHLTGALNSALSGYAQSSWVSTNFATITNLQTTNNALNTLTDSVSSLTTRFNDFLEGVDADNIINKWKELESFLSGFTETQTLAELLTVKADKTISITAGTGLNGGGTLASNRTISLNTASASDIGGIKIGSTLSIAADGTLNQISGVVAIGTYTKVTVDNYGRVTNGTSLLASDIPTLAISKIIGLQDALNLKLDKSIFNELFEKVNIGTAAAPVYAIKANFGFYSDQFISAKGLSAESGSGGGLDETLLWAILGGTGSQQINKTHISTALSEYVLLTDTRLVDARPASDVYTWAKAATKPSYAFSEITGTPPAVDLTPYVKKEGDVLTGELRFTSGTRHLVMGPAYIGFKISDTNSGWAQGFNFMNARGTILGAFGAYGNNQSLSYLFAGPSYEDYRQSWTNSASQLNIPLIISTHADDILVFREITNERYFKIVLSDTTTKWGFLRFDGRTNNNGLFFNDGVRGEHMVLDSGNHLVNTATWAGITWRQHGITSTTYTGQTFLETYGENSAYGGIGARGAWAYANNGYIITDYGNLPLAGTAYSMWGAGYNRTIMFITPGDNGGTPGAMVNELMFYTSNSSNSEYSKVWSRVITARNYNSYSPTLSGGGASGTWGISVTGNATTATRFSTNRHNYAGITNDSVAGQLMWKHYGNGHTVFDASNGTTPSGTSCDAANPMAAWSNTYPTLMGWSGTSTFGVRVYIANKADALQTARSIYGNAFDGTGDCNGIFRNVIGGSASWNIAHKILFSPASSHGLITRINGGSGDVSLQAERESNANETFRLILNPTGGNVGIGDLNPVYKLEVSGTCRISNVLVVKGSTGNYNEGIRLVGTSTTWSNIQFGVDEAAYGLNSTQWCVGKNPSNVFIIASAGNQSGTATWQHGNMIIHRDGSIAAGSVTANGVFVSNSHGRTCMFGSQNNDWCHMLSPVQFHFGIGVQVAGNLMPYENNTRNLGGASNYWNAVYSKQFLSYTMNSHPNTWAGVITYEPLVGGTFITGAPANTAQIALGWGNVINNVGYNTRYRIGSIRNASGWGHLALWVTNADDGSSGYALSLGGNGSMNWSGSLAVATSINSGSRITSGSDILSNGWVRTTGATGWYSESYGGGIYMLDSSWIRTYNGKSFYCDATLQGTVVIGVNRIHTGYDSGQTNSINCSNWFRCNGPTGLVNMTHGGGIYMTDSTWVRTYGGKQFYVDNGSGDAIHTAGGINITGRGRFGGNVIAENGYTVNYIPTSWISMAQGATPIVANQNNSASSAHCLYRTKWANGFAMCYGGLGDMMGFFAYSATNIANSGNARAWATYWTSAGILNHEGSFVASGEITAFSDVRLKTNISNLSFRGKLIPKTYIKDGKQQIGFIAQEVQRLYPELITISDGENHYLSLNYGSIAAVLSAQINIVEDEVTVLKRRVAELERIIANTKQCA